MRRCSRRRRIASSRPSARSRWCRRRAREGDRVPASRRPDRAGRPAAAALLDAGAARARAAADRSRRSTLAAATPGWRTARQVARALAARPTLSDEQRASGRAAVPRRRRRRGARGQGRHRQDVRARRGPRGVAGRRASGARRRDRAPRRGRAARRRRDPEHDARSRCSPTCATRDGPLPRRCVLVVDEAGMVPTREIAELAEHVAAVDGKLVLVGDHRQLPGARRPAARSARSCNRGLAIELHENVRQVHAWERRALDQLRDGRPEPALAAYAAHDRLTVEPTGDAARERLVADWWAAGDPDEAVMIAHRRADVADLNARARERMRAAGRARAGARDGRPGRSRSAIVVVVKRNDTAPRRQQRRPRPRRRRRARRGDVVIERRGRADPSRPPLPRRADRRPAIRRWCTATRSPATSPRASPSTAPSCSPARASTASGPTSR